ncbi:MAG: translocation/assembly module TamB [Acidobacteria bacterium]|nr:translocation/assembly module TamB [Acidobacteriota bacterium]
MKKIVFRAFLVLTLLISFGALLFLFWLQGNGFRDWISNRLDLELQKYNLCLSGDLKVDPFHFQAEIDNLKIQTCNSKETVLTAQHLYLKIRLISFVSKKFQLQDFLIDKPEVFIKFDSQGHSNFSQIQAPTKSGQETSFISTLNAVIRNGEIIYNDEKFKLSGELKNFTLDVAINKAKGHQVNLISKNSWLKYQDQDITLDEIVLQTKLSSDNAEIKSLKLTSNIAKANLIGRLEDWQSLKYNFETKAELDLKKAAPLIRFNQPISGTVFLEGKLSGEKLDYSFQGEIKSSEINAANNKFNKISLIGEIAKESFSGKVNIEKIQHQDILVKSFQSNSLKANKQTIKLEEFSATLFGGTIKGEARVSLENQLSQSSIKLTSIDIDSISNLLAKKSLPIRGKLNSEAKLSWTGINFNSFSSELTADFSGETGKFPTTTTKKTKPLENQVTDQNVNDNTSPLIDTLPFNGEVLAKINGDKVLLDKAIFTSKTTTLNTTGAIILSNQNFDLLAKIETINVLEIRQLTDTFGLKLPVELGLAPNSNKEQISLQGKLSFDGKLSGSINNPSVEGSVFIEQIFSGQENLGNFSGLINYQTDSLAINQGVLVQPSNGRADIKLDTKLSSGGNSLVNLRLRSFLISPSAIKTLQNIVAKSGSSVSIYALSALKNLDGEINGEMMLKGLPSVGDLRKSDSSFNLKNFLGELNLNIKNSHPQASFSNLAVKFLVENEAINFKQINIDLPAGNIAGSGIYNIPSRNYKVDLTSNKLNLFTFSEAIEQHSMPLYGIVSAKINGEGNIDNPVFNIKIAGSEIKLSNQTLRNIALTAYAKEGIASLSLTTTYQNLPYEINGKITLSDDLPLFAEIDLKDRSLLPLLALFTTVPPRLETNATGILKIQGPLSTDEGLSLKKVKALLNVSKFNARVKTSGDEEVAYEVFNEGPIELEAGLNRLVFNKFNLKGDQTSFSVAGRVGGGNNTLKLSGEINLRLLNSISNSLFVGGSASFSASLTNGNNLVGSADLKNISVRYIDSPISIQEGNGKILFSNDRALLDNFTAKSNGGQIKASGGLLFDKLNPNRFRLEVSATGLRVNYPDTVRSIVDSELLLQGSDKVQILNGKVTVRHSEYRQDVDLAKLIASNFVFSVGNLTSFAFGNTLNLNINVNAQDSLFVDNNVAEMIGGGSLKIGGTLNNPIISGRATISRGTLFLRNDQYNITRGIVDFPNSRNGQLRFDIEADTDLRGYRIILNLAGTLNRFNTLLRSEPALPQSDIISLITTGQLLPPGATAQSSDTQTRLSPALGLLSETLSQKVEQSTDKLFGLNRFQIDPLIAGRGTNPTARITLGRRITKNLSLTYSTNITTGQEQIVVVEYQVNRNISIIGTREQDGTYGFDIRFRKRF